MCSAAVLVDIVEVLGDIDERIPPAKINFN
jgi:hypothetical protein